MIGLSITSQRTQSGHSIRCRALLRILFTPCGILSSRLSAAFVLAALRQYWQDENFRFLNEGKPDASRLQHRAQVGQSLRFCQLIWVGAYSNAPSELIVSNLFGGVSSSSRSKAVPARSW